MLDSRIEIETPENIDLYLTPAGIWSRGLAYAIDFGIRFLCYAITGITLLILFRKTGQSGIVLGLYLIGIFVLEWFYAVLFEVLRNGQTPGKKRLNLKVVQQDGTPIGWASSITRNFLLIVDFLPFLYATAIVSIFSSKHFQRVGDLAAKTLVVYAPTPFKHTLENAKGQRTLSPIPLKKSEQQAFISFAQRQKSFSVARQKELANILTPLIKKTDDAAIQNAIAIANSL